MLNTSQGVRDQRLKILVIGAVLLCLFAAGIQVWCDQTIALEQRQSPNGFVAYATVEKTNRPSALANKAHLPTTWSLSSVAALNRSASFHLAPEPSARPRGIPQQVVFPSWVHNQQQLVSEAPISHFWTDVDQTSYAFVRGNLQQGQWPQPQAVRLEELVNYFRYDYDKPPHSQPLQIYTEVGPSPWDAQAVLLQIGLQANHQLSKPRSPIDVTLLVDTSGSMQSPKKLPLVRQTLKLLVSQLQPQDRVQLVGYADQAQVILPWQPVKDGQSIRQVIDTLQASGHTNGAAGLKLAYAQLDTKSDRLHRVVLCSDGHFNQGITQTRGLQSLLRQQKATQAYLTVLGVGLNHYDDLILQTLAQAGQGQAFFLDTYQEAKRILQQQVLPQWTPILHNVQVQVEFNPKHIESYRLLGYEQHQNNGRRLQSDSGAELGEQAQVTALYELKLVDGPSPDLRYQSFRKERPEDQELAYVQANYQYTQQDLRRSQARQVRFPNPMVSWQQTSSDFRWASLVAWWAQILAPHSQHPVSSSLSKLETLAAQLRVDSLDLAQREWLQLLQASRSLQ